MKTERISDPKVFDIPSIERHLASGRVVIQFSRPSSYDEEMLDALDAICAKYSPQLDIRFYGHHGSAFDGKILNRLPNVKSLVIDCLEHVENLHALGTLEHLERLRLPNIFDPDVLSYDNLSKLKDLTVGSLRAPLNLRPLSRFEYLTDLTIIDNVKNLEVIGGLCHLRHLSLNSIKKCPLEFVNAMTGLINLSLILGGRDSIDEIDGTRIEHLELIRVRGFAGFAALNAWQALKTLEIEDEVRIEHLSFASELENLSYLGIANCKGLRRLDGLATLPALTHLRLAQTAIDFDALCQSGLPASLRQFAFHTFRKRQDDAIHAKIASMGYQIGNFFDDSMIATLA